MDKISGQSYENLLSNEAALEQFVLNHVSRQERQLRTFSELTQPIRSLIGGRLHVCLTGSLKTQDRAVFVNNQELIATDHRCRNGVVHTINSPLVPAHMAKYYQKIRQVDH
eukprot:Filipodium_phascolosomae@DN7425_c0_g1_i1.p1